MAPICSRTSSRAGSYDNILYFLKTNNGLLSAYDAVSGKPHYQVQRLPKAQEISEAGSLTH